MAAPEQLTVAFRLKAWVPRLLWPCTAVNDRRPEMVTMPQCGSTVRETLTACGLSTAPGGAVDSSTPVYVPGRMLWLFTAACNAAVAPGATAPENGGALSH